MKDYIQGMFDNGYENVIRVFVTNNFGHINHTPFISRCRRVLKFKSSTSDNITCLISKALSVSEEEALPLAVIIERRESERSAKEAILQQAEKESEEKKSKPEIKPFEPLGYRDLNYFLSEFIGVERSIPLALARIDSWINERGDQISGSDSTTHEGGCSIM